MRHLVSQPRRILVMGKQLRWQHHIVNRWLPNRPIYHKSHLKHLFIKLLITIAPKNAFVNYPLCFIFHNQAFAAFPEKICLICQDLSDFPRFLAVITALISICSQVPSSAWPNILIFPWFKSKAGHSLF